MTTCLAPTNTPTDIGAPADIMIACDDLYCDPFDTTARDRVQTLLIPGRHAAMSEHFASAQNAPATTPRTENINASQVKGEHAMSPSSSDQPSSADADYALVRGYSRELKIACDELHDNPFDTAARETLKTLIAERSKAADAALDRLTAEQSTPSPCRTR
jgi:hypothetical protein